MLVRLWLLAAASALLAVCSNACSLLDESDVALANRLSGASAAARSGGFSTLLEVDPSWGPFGAVEGSEGNDAVGAFPSLELSDNSWEAYDGGEEGDEGADWASDGDVEIEMEVEQGSEDEEAAAAMLRELSRWVGAVLGARGDSHAGYEDRLDRSDRFGPPGVLLSTVLGRLRDAASRTGAQVVALEITLEASAQPARRALPRPLLQRPPVPPAERGAQGWQERLAARSLPRMCPLLLTGAVVFALAAALACHFTQVWEARQARLMPYARIEVAANNPLLEPLRAGPLLDTQHELMRR